jgi:hypothetical protein
LPKYITAICWLMWASRQIVGNEQIAHTQPRLDLLQEADQVEFDIMRTLS